MKRPNSRTHLDNAIRRIAGLDQAFVSARTLLADAVVAQMLPNGAVKGGSALKIRFGEGETRFSDDLDTARTSSIESYVGDLAAALREGWEGFTGLLVRREPRIPEGLPAQYAMQPFEVKLSYLGKPWTTVRLEIGHNEIGDADEPDMVVPKDAARLFEALGFPAPKPVPLMPIPHQIAQKLHGASEDGSRRAHDLIDLQLIDRFEDIDPPETREVCMRLFAYRKKQAWPPRIVRRNDWDGIYAYESEGLEVLPTVDEAIAWANEFIDRIERAGK